MRKITLLLFILCVNFINAQAFKGEDDFKFQVGGTFQENGSGITSSIDFGLAENLSFGFVATYLLNTKDIGSASADFEDKADIKIRINANIGNVLNVDDNFDVYPGLSLGTRNFGGHLGLRYFFSDGFGIYSETFFPLARYDNNVVGFERLNNQFVLNIGAVFNF